MFDGIKNVFRKFEDEEIYRETKEDKFWRRYFSKMPVDYYYETHMSEFPISKKRAVEIANQNYNLKSDFIRNSTYESVSWLSFNKYNIELVESNGRKYWNVQVLDADISYFKFSDNDEDFPCCCDGWVGPTELTKLSCFIDVENGQYLYAPKERLDDYEF